MDLFETSHFRRTVKHVGLGGAGVAAITAICFALRADFAITGCLYLLLVVLQSTVASFTASAMVAVLAIGCLDYFFIPPLFTLRVSSPLDALALVTFLITTLVITRLASKARDEARNAEARRKDLARLYQLASRLVSVNPQGVVERKYLDIFREIFDLRAIVPFRWHGRGSELRRQFRARAQRPDQRRLTYRTTTTMTSAARSRCDA